MKVFKCVNKDIKNENLLLEALGIDTNKKQIISFVGAGGKTSLIYELGEQISKLGKKVIITTTTHMFIPENNAVLTGKKEDMVNLLKNKNLITVGVKESLEKIKGLPTKMTEKLIELADFVLIEADGSKRFPLKVPDEHEPVILDGSDLVIGVSGIDAIGKTIKDTCHRPNLVADFLEVDINYIIRECDIAKIMLSDMGQKKNVKCNYKIIINKVDDEELVAIALKISSECYKMGMKELILTTFREKM